MSTRAFLKFQHFPGTLEGSVYALLCVQALGLADLEALRVQGMKAKAESETTCLSIKGMPSMHTETPAEGSPFKGVSLPSLADRSVRCRKIQRPQTTRTANVNALVQEGYRELVATVPVRSADDTPCTRDPIQFPQLPNGIIENVQISNKNYKTWEKTHKKV